MSCYSIIDSQDRYAEYTSLQDAIADFERLHTETVVAEQYGDTEELEREWLLLNIDSTPVALIVELEP